MSVGTRHLILLLLLQFHGWEDGRPALALVPPPTPERMQERLVMPLSLHYRRQIQAQLESLAKSPSCPPVDPASPTDSPSPTSGSPCPVRVTDPLYALMSMQC